MRHDQLRHLRCLRLLLSQDKSPLGFSDDEKLIAKSNP